MTFRCKELLLLLCIPLILNANDCDIDRQAKWNKFLIDKELSDYYKKPITENQMKALDSHLKEGRIRDLVRFEIVNNKVYSSYDASLNEKFPPFLVMPFRYMVMLTKISELAKKGLLRNNTFLILFDDGVWDSPTAQNFLNTPIFVFSKEVNY